ncbi:sensor histidine kinase [Myroides fluvii]|uniref:sensor histidine kinase n=1 Tax=Myroides fluvii TaxID=2572594 RepID=UPI00131C61D6|nr:ATP-binding protein [Myroides fluvii]
MSFHLKVFVRILTIIGLSLIAVWLFLQAYTYTFFIGILVIIGCLIELYSFQRKYYGIIDRLVLAMIYNDFSLKSNKKQTNETFHNLQQLYQKLQHEQEQNEIKELVYLNILNNLETGIVIFERGEKEWNIFLINDYFAKLFDIPKVKSWQNLSRLLPNLTQYLEHLEFKESKTSLDMRIEGEEKQTFILQTSITTSQNQEFYIVLLDSIQKVLDKKEKDTWENLMKVISHEIMNSLTPIHSLAHNTLGILEEETSLTADDMDDLKLSIQTIANRTDHLRHFIDNYRKLTMLPSPQKTWVNSAEIIANSMAILKPICQQYNINLHKTIETQVSQYWDSKQMEQVFINVLTNAIYAVKNQEEKMIQVHVYERNNRLWIDIIDNGKGIPEEIKPKIFIPFYTTREDGAGIGLPLSKNIVEMHKGYLTFNRKEALTYFSINFPLG